MLQIRGFGSRKKSVRRNRTRPRGQTEMCFLKLRMVLGVLLMGDYFPRGASSRWSCMASYPGCPSFWSGRLAWSVLGVDCSVVGTPSSGGFTSLLYLPLARFPAQHDGGWTQFRLRSSDPAGRKGNLLIIDGCWATSYCEWAARAG